MKTRNMTLIVILGLGLGASVHTPLGWTAVVISLLVALVVAWLPVWPKKIEIRIGLNEYRHKEAKQHLGFDQKTVMSIRTGSRDIWVPRGADLKGCSRFTLNLLDTRIEDMELVTTEFEAMVIPSRARNADHWLSLLNREDVVWWYVGDDRCGLFSQRYSSDDPEWIPIRPTRLDKHQVRELTVSGRIILVNFVGGDTPDQFMPAQMRIVIQPMLTGVYVTERMDFDNNHALCRMMLIVAPSLDAIRQISTGPVADLVAVAYKHPGVLCRNCGYPKGLSQQPATCYCNDYNPNPTN